MSTPRKQSTKDPVIEAVSAYVAAERCSYEADQALSECEVAAKKAYPEIPPMIRNPGRPRDPMTLFEAARASIGPDDFEHRKSLIEKYKANIEEVRSRAGVPKFDAIAEEALAEARRLMRVLRDTRATTAAGMLAKLRIAIDVGEEGFVEEVNLDCTYIAPSMFSSVVADLKRMVGDGKILIGVESESVSGSSAHAGRSEGT
jgi:hypothetical protein